MGACAMMQFDPTSATPVSGGFDPDSATPVTAPPTRNGPSRHRAPLAAQQANAPMNGFQRAISDFMAPVKSAAQQVANDAQPAIQATQQFFQAPSLQGYGNMVAQTAKSAMNPLHGLDVLNAVSSPVQGAINAATHPAADALFNSGLGFSKQVGVTRDPQTGNMMINPAATPDLQATHDALNNGVNLALLASSIKNPLDVKAPAMREVAQKHIIPSIDDLQAAKTAAYQQADNVGAIYHPDAVNNMVDSLTADLASKRLNPKLAPTSAGLLEEVQSLKDNPASFRDIEDMRQLVNQTVGPMSSDREKMYAGMIRDKLSEFMDNAGPQDMLAGDPVAQSQAINQARALNVAYKKSQSIQEALNRADLNAASSGSGGNIDNATRQRLKALLVNKRMYWTPEEEAALNAVVRGGPVQNLLRLVGKLSPEGNGLMMAGQVAAGAATHGASVPTALAGIGAKHAAEFMTGQKVRNLQQIVADASPYAQVSPPTITQMPVKQLPDLRAGPPLLSAVSDARQAGNLALPLPVAAEPPRKDKRRK